MDQIAQLAALGLFEAQVPRYTSYPTAPVFTPATGAAFQTACLEALEPETPVSVYVHIPFCERLCWFCACRTQGTRSLDPVDRYLGFLEREITAVAARLPAGTRMGRLHWGGGTPTILTPAMIVRLSEALFAAIPPTDDLSFSVEIDPTLVDADKIAALAAMGMTRASIGVQDFDGRVQAAIGRAQPYDVTAGCIADLRAAGIGSLNTDLVYGLPCQTPETLDRTLDLLAGLDPDRVALFGYAHVPHMAPRQKLIPTAALPNDPARFALARQAAERFGAQGLTAIGIDHFAKPSDSLASAAASGHLRRNFQGYTTDRCPTLIGFGASAISRFAQGHVQNAAATAAYQKRIEGDGLAGHRGHALSAEDRLRGRAIEMLMCDFRLDFKALQQQFGAASEILAPVHRRTVAQFGPVLDQDATGMLIRPEGRPLTRMIAAMYDAYANTGAIYSRAS